MINGPILSKLNLLDEVLNELRTLGPVTLAQPVTSSCTGMNGSIQ